jgi:hypothetical protein
MQMTKTDKDTSKETANTDSKSTEKKGGGCGSCGCS